jgi:hypothetical protein
LDPRHGPTGAHQREVHRQQRVQPRLVKLKKKRVANPPDKWIRREGAFEPLIELRLFYTAQGMIRERSRRLSDEELLGHLQRLFERHGHLSGLLIDETEGMPSSPVYRGRFGSLIRAYGLVGYTPARDYRYIEINRYLRRMHAEMVADVIANIERLGGVVDRDRDTELLTINGEFSASLVLARCQKTEAGHRRWLIRLDAGPGPTSRSRCAWRPATARSSTITYCHKSTFEQRGCGWAGDATPGDPHDLHRADHRS